MAQGQVVAAGKRETHDAEADEALVLAMRKDRVVEYRRGGLQRCVCHLPHAALRRRRAHGAAAPHFRDRVTSTWKNGADTVVDGAVLWDSANALFAEW
ncbi:hypothetical protein GCM10010409_33310 [Mycolicibacterium diernhoferi]